MQSLEDGRAFFDVQVRELRNAERREKVLEAVWRYRRPARTVGIAILVGVLAYWMRRSGGFPVVRETFWGFVGWK
jgi:hypothetical protein